MRLTRVRGAISRTGKLPWLAKSRQSSPSGDATRHKASLDRHRHTRTLNAMGKARRKNAAIHQSGFHVTRMRPTADKKGSWLHPTTSATTVVPVGHTSALDVLSRQSRWQILRTLTWSYFPNEGRHLGPFQCTLSSASLSEEVDFTIQKFNMGTKEEGTSCIGGNSIEMHYLIIFVQVMTQPLVDCTRLCASESTRVPLVD